MYYPDGMKARVKPVQSIEPHRILAPTRDSNQQPPGPQSRVVTTILPLHTIITRNPSLSIQLPRPAESDYHNIHSELYIRGPKT